MRVLQIALFTSDTMPILIGVRELPIHKLVLLFTSPSFDAAQKFGRDIARSLEIEVEYERIGDDVFRETIDTIARIVTKESPKFEVFINVTSAEQLLSCAAISAAFVSGAKAFHIAKDAPVMLPVIKLSYENVLSDAKLAILKTLVKADGKPLSMSELAERCQIDKSLVSYHLRGGRETRGLEELGLVTVERGKQGKIDIVPTMLGKILAGAG